MSVRYFFHIGYNGFNYEGWQKLPQANSVQAVIETALCRILKTETPIIGCGRTDGQVHASQFFFHADIDKHWDYDLTFRLNKNLPHDIAVFEIIPMEGKPHARLHAVSRTYDYFVHTCKDPYLNDISALYMERDFNLHEMTKAVQLLPRYNDYRAFCKNANVHRTTLCNVSSANLFVDERGDKIRFTISANRFLYGMIRILMNKFLLIGRGQMSVNEFEHHLITRIPPKLNRSAYPQGLYLSQVRYPFLERESQSTFFQALVEERRWTAV